MLPEVGDDVQFTEEILNADSQRDQFRGKKLNVLRKNMTSIIKNGQLFELFLSDGSTLHKEDGVDNNGNKLVGTNIVKVFEPWGGGYSPVKQRALDENDRCKKCGAMGDVRGMSCICPGCGHTIWGI